MYESSLKFSFFTYSMEKSWLMDIKTAVLFIFQVALEKQLYTDKLNFLTVHLHNWLVVTNIHQESLCFKTT